METWSTLPSLQTLSWLAIVLSRCLSWSNIFKTVPLAFASSRRFIWSLVLSSCLASPYFSKAAWPVWGALYTLEKGGAYWVCQCREILEVAETVLSCLLPILNGASLQDGVFNLLQEHAALSSKILLFLFSFDSYVLRCLPLRGKVWNSEETVPQHRPRLVGKFQASESSCLKNQGR